MRHYERQPWDPEQKTEIQLVRNFGQRAKVEVPRAEGGDDRLRDLIFGNVSVPDYMRLPDSRAAAISCLTGVAALRSQDEGRPVRLAELLPS